MRCRNPANIFFVYHLKCINQIEISLLSQKLFGLFQLLFIYYHFIQYLNEFSLIIDTKFPLSLTLNNCRSRVNVCHLSHRRALWKSNMVLVVYLVCSLRKVYIMLGLILSKSWCVVFKNVCCVPWYLLIFYLGLWRSKYVCIVFRKISSSVLCLVWSEPSFFL